MAYFRVLFSKCFGAVLSPHTLSSECTGSAYDGSYIRNVEDEELSIKCMRSVACPRVAAVAGNLPTCGTFAPSWAFLAGSGALEVESWRRPTRVPVATAQWAVWCGGQVTPITPSLLPSSWPRLPRVLGLSVLQCMGAQDAGFR